MEHCRTEPMEGLDCEPEAPEVEYDWVTCLNCKGSGHIDVQIDVDLCDRYTCQECSGQGEVEIEIAPQEAIHANRAA